MTTSTEFFCEQANFGRNINIHAVFRDTLSHDKQWFAMVSAKEAAEADLTQPAFSVSRKEAQVLMDQLWMCGMRPSEGSGSAGSLAATERHLKDLRAIAMGLLLKDGVELK